MKLNHQKKFFLLILTIFFLTHEITFCMESKKRIYQEIKSSSSTEEHSYTEESFSEESFEEKSSAEDFFIKKPPYKKLKIDISKEEKEEKNDPSYQNNSSATAPLLCNYPGCNKTFTQKYNLNRHMVIHSDKKEYQCSQCDKAFKRKYDLQQHSDVHNNIWYFCKYKNCNKKFQTKPGLYEHIKTKHKNIRHYCSQCNSNFSTQASLNVHIKTKHKNIHYYCPQCDKNYSTKGNLTTHTRKKH